MCTVTWLFDERGGYTLFCNRDEKFARATAEPPRIAYRNGVRYIAPCDAEYGGTWISVNEAGVSLCLLNAAGGRAFVSRGLLVSAVADSVSQEEVLRRLRNAPLSRFAGFQLAVLEPVCEPLIIGWDGYRLSTVAAEDICLPLTSSSIDSERVHEARAALFQKLRPATCIALEAFHRSHEPAQGPYSVCVHRSDASTVSFTEVTVARQTVSMAYCPGPPCERRPAVIERIYVSLSADCAVHAGQ
jgi:hypothetical protein